MNAETAGRLAEQLLAADLPRRWSHVSAVAAKAEYVAERLSLPADVLVSAAWLHDIGYAPDVVDTGFHPLDGARYLRARGVDERVVSLVAHHSCAELEASTRGIGPAALVEFNFGPGVLQDAISYCDMTTGPDGQSFAVGERLEEIRERYGPGHPVARFVNEAEPMIRAAVDRTERRMAQAARPVT